LEGTRAIEGEGLPADGATDAGMTVARFFLSHAPFSPPLSGGLIFGWNALALMLRDQGAYSDACPADGRGKEKAGER